MDDKPTSTAPSRAWLKAFRARLERAYQNPASDKPLEELLSLLEQAEGRGVSLQVSDSGIANIPARER